MATKSNNPSISSRDSKKVSAFLRQKFPDGLVTAEQVLELARPRNSPIHEYFNWDDTDAAEKYRLNQARKLITCLVVMIDDKQVRQYTTPVRVENVDKKSYCEINRARQDEDIWAQVLSSAMRDAILWQRRYETIKALSPIRAAISKTHKKLKAKGAINA